MVNPMSTFLGKISFSLYPVHFFVIGLFREAEVLRRCAEMELAYELSDRTCGVIRVRVCALSIRQVPGIALGKRAIDYIRG